MQLKKLKQIYCLSDIKPLERQQQTYLCVLLFQYKGHGIKHKHPVPAHRAPATGRIYWTFWSRTGEATLNVAMRQQIQKGDYAVLSAGC